MKKTIVVAMVFAAFMAGSGCIKDKEKDFAEDQVSFSANTGALETRTEYGASGQNNSVQYVDWVDGDRITILMSTGSSDNYTIAREYRGSDSDGISKASLTAQGSGLSWGSGTGDRTFYAMYPAAGTEGSALTSSAMTAVIPATWEPIDDDLVRLPLGYMYATLTTPRTRTVSLTFNPKFTAFCFTLKNPTTSPVTLSSLSLSSDSKAMSGTFTVDPSSGAIASLPNPGANKSVTVDFTSLTDGGLVIPGGTPANPGTRTFTLVAVPDTFSDLTVSCTSSGGASRTLPLKKSDSYLTFDALKKHNINITLPSFAAFEYTFSANNPTLTYNGTSSSGSVTSYKSNDGGTNKTPVPWFVEGYYATLEDAEAGQNKLSAFDTTGPLSSAIADASAPSAASTSVIISYYAATATTLGNYIDDNIKNSTFGAKSSSSRYINLANPANLASDTESDTIVESANCYIVNGPGYYRIPLMMGNGYYTDDYYNYKGAAISTNAYLKNQGGTLTSAVVIWEDVDGLIDGASSINNWVIPNSINGDWLKFHIAKDKIKQGNAIIAVKDGDGKVMWSYHIWVTDYVPANYVAVLGGSSVDITYTNSQSKIYQVPPYDLGMVVSGTSTNTSFYLESTINVRLGQGTSDNPTGKYAVMEIKRPKHEGTIGTTDTQTGHCVYYQWGRKDPLQGNYTTYGEGKGMHGGASTTNNNMRIIEYNILNPNDYNSAVSSFSLNTVWDPTQTPKTGTTNNRTKDKVITKTIYDPSPAGYHIPPYSALSGSFSLPNLSYRSSATGMNATGGSYRWTSLRSYDSYAFSVKETGSGVIIQTSAVPVRVVNGPLN